ncbi:MAG: TonB-dependent receptor, partial [Steroidobacteraceae bacterium]
TTPGAAGFVFPTCAGGLNQFGDYQRPQVNGALQWRPSDNLEWYADGMYTEYESRWETDFIFTDPFFAQSITNVQATSDCGTYRSNGAGFYPPNPSNPVDNITQNLCVGGSARFNNVPGLTSTQAHDSGTEQYLLATGARWSSGALQLDADVSFQRSHNHNRTIIVDIGKQVAAVDLTLNGGKHGTIDMPGNPLGEANDFRFANGLFQDINDSLGKEFAFAGNGRYDLGGLLDQLQFGVRYADRDADFRSTVGGPPAPGGNRATLVNSVGLPGNFLVPSPSSISYIDGGQHWLTPNRDFLLDQTDTLRALYGQAPGDPAFDPSRNFDASEKTYAGYLQGKYELQVGGMQLDGLVGARLTRSDRTLLGTGRVNGVLTPVNTDTSDTDVLPNLSARLRITPELQVRFTAAKTLARPAFGDLNPGLTYDVPLNTNIRPGGFGGNPDLKPQKSDAYDATVEYYFARSSYLSAAIYYRDITDRTVPSVQLETIDAIDYLINRPRNVGAATLQGAELSGQLFLDSVFDSLPSVLGGFGVMANYTLAVSEVKTEGDPLEGRPLLGVSKHNYNLGLLYEKYGFTSRLVYTYRSGYDEFILCCTARPVGSGEGTVDAFGAGTWFNKVYANGRLDFSLGYDITPSVTVSVEGTNLTSENYYSYFQEKSLPHDVRDDERTYGMSLRARF